MLLVTETGQYKGETPRWIHKVDFPYQFAMNKTVMMVVPMLLLLFNPLLSSTELKQHLVVAADITGLESIKY